MGDIEYGNCSVCNTQAPLSRQYYYYDIQCDCCNGKKDNHFEIVYYCSNCTPKPPRKISVSLKPLKDKFDKVCPHENVTFGSVSPLGKLIKCLDCDDEWISNE